MALDALKMKALARLVVRYKETNQCLGGHAAEWKHQEPHQTELTTT